MRGDAKVIDYLNRGLRSELTAVNQYWLHYRIVDTWGYKDLAQKWRKESIEEMHHADRFVDRILFLDGFPNMQVLDPLRIGQNIEEILSCDLAAEIEARALYLEAAAYCDSINDRVTKLLFEELSFRPEKFFADNKIELIAKTRVTAIDRTNKRVALSSGGALDYDHLVLALGAHNRTLPIPGADLDGVFGLRTLADADAIGMKLADATEIVVAGAGFIGLEFAAVASALGKSVHVLGLAYRTMARAVSPAMSQLFADAHASWGVKIDFGQGLARIDGARGRVTGVETTGGHKRAADIVVFGIGVLPNVAIAAEAGLGTDNGIKVDAALTTSDPAISAIGDCAAFPSAHAGSHVRLE